jgi:tetratricopeptide (TPR) repeat protein
MEAYLAAQKLMGDDPVRAVDPARGVAAFEKLHEIWQSSGDAANNLGFWYREQKKYDLSLAWYLKAVERDPESQDILNDTGLIYLFHFPREREKGLPFFEKTIALVLHGDQKPERGYWDALENLCKHYTEVDPQPENVLRFAKMRYEVTKGVPPYNMSQVAEQWAKKARKALGR